MKRVIAAVIVGLVLVVGAGLVLLPYLVSSESVRAQIISQAETLTGRHMSFRDAPKIFLNPYLGIEISSVIFEGPKEHPDDPPLVQMEKLRGRIAVLPVLFGRIEIYQYQFVRPRFSLKVLADGRASWAFPKGRVWEVLGQARDIRQAAEPNAKIDLSGVPRLPLGDFEVVDGIVDYDDAQSGSHETITNVNAQLRWPDTASAWTIKGTGIWRDESLDYSITTARPLLLMAGGTSAATGVLKSNAFEFNFAGDANLLAGLHLSGNATLGTPSIARLVNFFGGKPEIGTVPGAVEATGKLSGTWRQSQLSDAVVTIDGNQGRGVLQLAFADGNRPQINATLAFQTFDLTPYLASLRQEAEIGRPEVAGLRVLDRFDCDIRLSATRAMLGAMTASNVGAALSVRNSELLFDLGSATLYGGNATGKFALKRKDDISQLSAEAVLAGASLAPMIDSLPKGPLTASGKADIKLTLRSAGKSVKRLSSQLRGWASVSAGKGTLSGVNLKRLRAAAARNGDDAAALKLTGDTAYESITGDVIFDNQTIWLRGIELDSAELRARLAGRADLVWGGLALRARIASRKQGAAEPDTLLVIGGVISSPLVTRDSDVDGEPAGPRQ